jgi:PKD repeat protein
MALIVVPCTSATVQSDGTGDDLLSSANLQGVHPRLYFTGDDLGDLRQKAQTEPYRSYFSRIKNIADKYMYTSNFPSGPDEGTLTYVAEAIRYPAFVYVVTGDMSYGQKAKENLIKFCSWSTWTPSGIDPLKHDISYVMGEPIQSAGEAYDWLYGLLSVEERKLVRDAILNKSLIPAYEDYQDVGSYYSVDSNRGLIAYGGIGIAALAIKEDDPVKSIDKYFPVVHNAMEANLNAFGVDGGWGEGIGYQSYGLGSCGIWYIEALRQVTGENLYQHERFKHAFDFPLYFMPPDQLGRSSSFCDGSQAAFYYPAVIARFASEYDNRYAQWYYQTMGLSDYPRIGDYLWYDDSLPAVAPTNLPTSKHFRTVDWSVFRTGWTENDIFFAFKSAVKARDHDRQEENSFVLDAYGERLIIAPGESSLGYSDSNYNDWYKATVSKNTILVNGDIFSQDLEFDKPYTPEGDIQEFISTPSYEAVTGEAAPAYDGILETFQRNVMFVKPNYFVMLDDLESRVGPVEYDFLLHALGSNSIHVNGDSILITQNKVTLHAIMLSPESFRYTILPGKPVYLDGADKNTSYIKVWPSVKTSEEQFLTVLYPLRDGDALPPVTKIGNDDDMGVMVERPEGTDRILFDLDGDGIDAGGIQSDGIKCMVTSGPGGISQYAIHTGSSLSFEGKEIFISGAPVTAAFSHDVWKAEGEVQARYATSITINSQYPERIEINGVPLSNPGSYYDATRGTCTIPVGVGSNVIAIVVSGAPPSNFPPVLDPIGDKTAHEKQLIEFSVSAADADGDELSYAVEGLPKGASFAGQVFHWIPDSDDIGDYSVTFTVYDGEFSDSETICISVQESPQMGAIHVSTFPTGALIFLDGEDTGRQTEATIDSVESGEHLVSVVKEGYMETSEAVVVEAGATLDVGFTLAPVAVSPQEKLEECIAYIPTMNTFSSIKSKLTAILKSAIYNLNNEMESSAIVDLEYFLRYVATYSGRYIPVEDGNYLIGTVEEVMNSLQNPLNPPIAAFEVDPASGMLPLTVAFTDTSTPGDGITTWSWDVDGDGIEDYSTPNPVHIYTKAGTYSPALTVSGPGGSDTIATPDCIYVDSPVDFSADVTEGPAPLTVTFRDDTAGGEISGWRWDVDGDGTVDYSVQTPPPHTYTEPGTYEVRLTVTIAGVECTKCKAGFIVVGDGADVTVVSIKPTTGEFVAEQTNSFDVTVRNIGESKVGSFDLLFRSKGMSSPGTSQIKEVGELSPGQSATIRFTDSTTWSEGESVTLEATADYENEVAESDENNNRLQKDYIVAGIQESPIEKTHDLIGYIYTMDGSSTSKSTMMSILNRVITDLKYENDDRAIYGLNYFIGYVRKIDGRYIYHTDAVYLINEAEQIIGIISSS